ncbi:MAG: glycosyl hydrolase 115 family protein [Bacteroidales bacterium]|nr:glycosyl hydrolase 115 family protein [Bacteroidales bacterium]
MKRLFIILATLTFLASSCGNNGGFHIAKDGKTACIVIDQNDWKGVIRAAQDLGDDVKKVSGKPSEVKNALPQPDGNIIVGTIGKSRLIDSLVNAQKIDVSKIKGQWEAYQIVVVDGNLVIAGSDKRGTIYGIYEISKQIGVSPWYWWADVPVKHSETVVYNGGKIVQPSPKVKYRGIFINDEDWGLKPWSSKNFEKDLGDIGPKTYAKVCELLLRLRANMLAPAMHSCTGAFYSHKESKAVCDSFGIIITTSHCEPLLLNNAADSEWNQERDGEWNFKTNRETILKKWDDRLSEASMYENIYTVAMRGVHDEGLRGNMPIQERVPLLDTVIQMQRALLAQHIGKQATEIPQIFVPYKETMDIYENGLKVPDDIILVWVDDNYGYMKRVADPEEQKRSGGSGVYYHLSYLGAPHDYLWLNTTPPVLMYEELKKAYDNGANRYWLLNVGDIKPMETGLQTFIDLAWNIDKFDYESVNSHQAKFLASIFGADKEKDFQDILDDYYRLAWARKPEYMGFEYEWDDPAHTGLKPTEFSIDNYDEFQQRLADYQRISDLVEKLDDHSAAYYELVKFPTQAAFQMNRKFMMAQLNGYYYDKGDFETANWAAKQSQSAFDSINALNNHYNSLLDGKWNYMMSVPPGFCALYQQMPELKITENSGEKPADLSLKKQPVEGCSVIDLSAFKTKSQDAALIKGIGYDNQVMQLGEVTYNFEAQGVDSVEIIVWTVPFWPLYKGKTNAIEISVDGGTVQVFDNVFKEYSRSWKDQVMRNGISCKMRFVVDKSQNTHTLTFKANSTLQMLQKIIVDYGGMKESYLGPKK